MAPAAETFFYTLHPCRVLDTRLAVAAGGGPSLVPAADRLVSVTGCGVPADATAVSANLTVVNPASAGMISVFAGNASYGGTGEVSFPANVSRANNAFLMLATDATGTLKVRNLSALPVNFLLDINGYFR